jgi:hypothetical protein
MVYVIIGMDLPGRMWFSPQLFTPNRRMTMELTPQAAKKWNAIPAMQRLRILNNVWCVGCMKNTSMGEASGRIEKGQLSLKGICTRCGGVVARVVE